MTIIGDEFKRRRIDLGITQTDVALGAGVTQMTISNIETGRVKDPGAMMVVNIARTLGMDLREIAHILATAVDAQFSAREATS